jgi:hypothetical protein
MLDKGIQFKFLDEGSLNPGSMFFPISISFEKLSLRLTYKYITWYIIQFMYIYFSDF